MLIVNDTVPVYLVVRNYIGKRCRIVISSGEQTTSIDESQRTVTQDVIVVTPIDNNSI